MMPYIHNSRKFLIKMVLRSKKPVLHLAAVEQPCASIQEMNNEKQLGGRFWSQNSKRCNEAQRSLKEKTLHSTIICCFPSSFDDQYRLLAYGQRYTTPDDQVSRKDKKSRKTMKAQKWKHCEGKKQIINIGFKSFCASSYLGLKNHDN